MTERTETTQLYIPALGRIYEALAPFAYPLLRLTVGLMAVPHGMQKLFQLFGGNRTGTAALFTKYGIEPAMPLVYLVGTVEFFAGLAIAVGFLTRPAAALLFGVMFVAVFKVHINIGFFWTQLGLEYPLMWGLALIVIAIRGGGLYSVDKSLGKEI